MGKLAQRAVNRIAPAQNESIQFLDDAGNEIVLTSEDVRANICQSASPKEVKYFLEMCRANRLNPFLSEAYLVKYGNGPAQMVTAHKVLLRRAESHPNYAGMEHGVVVLRDGEIDNVQRQAVYKEAGEQLIGGWCRVYRNDREHPTYAERSLAETTKGQSSWKSMPALMVDKCAQAAALREAFPAEFRSLYTQEEGGMTIESEVEPVHEQPRQQTLSQKLNPDKDELRQLTDDLVAIGFDEASTKAWLWDIYKAEGIEGVRDRAAAAMAQGPAQEVEVVAEEA